MPTAPREIEQARTSGEGVIGEAQTPPIFDFLRQYAALPTSARQAALGELQELLAQPLEIDGLLVHVNASQEGVPTMQSVLIDTITDAEVDLGDVPPNYAVVALNRKGEVEGLYTRGSNGDTHAALSEAFWNAAVRLHSELSTNEDRAAPGNTLLPRPSSEIDRVTNTSLYSGSSIIAVAGFISPIHNDNASSGMAGHIATRVRNQLEQATAR